MKVETKMYQLLSLLLILNTVSNSQALSREKFDRGVHIAESFTLSTGTTNDDSVTQSTVIKGSSSTTTPGSTSATTTGSSAPTTPGSGSSTKPSSPATSAGTAEKNTSTPASAAAQSTTTGSDTAPSTVPSTDAARPQQDVDFGPYMAALQKAIKRSWFPPKGDETKRVVAIFQVKKNGDIGKLRIDKSSGVSRADQAALRAVRNASPFQPLPDGSPPNVDIQFTFDYNVYKKGENRENWYQFYSKRADVANWAGRAAKTASTKIGPGLESLSKTESFNATLRCKVKSDGSASDWSIHTSSGNTGADTKILDYAKENVKVVDAPPEGLPTDETVELGVVIVQEP